MKEIGASFVFFTVFTVLLLCAHKRMLRYGKRTLAIFLVYPLGLIAFGVITTLSYAAMIVYSLLSLLAFILLITPVLGDTAPTSRMLLYLRDHRRSSVRALVQLFSDKTMIEKRLDDLVTAGLVCVHDGRYMATAAGKLVAWVIVRYVKLIDWEMRV